MKREQDLLRKRPGTFGKDRREPLSKLLNKWGAGKDVEGTPGPGDYCYMEKDTFGGQIKTMNARCQLQEELKSQLMEGDIIEKYMPNGNPRTSRRRQKSKSKTTLGFGKVYKKRIFSKAKDGWAIKQYLQDVV